jgi:acetate kinase
MSDAILVLNAGSSSIKFAAFARADARSSHTDPVRLLHGEIDGLDASAHLLEWLTHQLPGHAVCAVAHRVVHGAEAFTQPVRATPDVLAQLDALSPLAPLHQPHNLAAIRVIADLQPDWPQFACFDTAFHAGQAWTQQAYALPRRVREAGVRRYGFHGLSYEYIASILPEHLGALADQRVVVAHLGNGASMCAMHQRRSVSSSMGFTALDGLMMGTRSGSLDPGVILYLATAMGMDMQAIETMLYKESGLLGVSELSSDMRTLEASDDPRAGQAIAMFVSRISQELGRLAAVLGGLDAIVFTAGIGEHSSAVRQHVCEAAAWLGVDIDATTNRTGALRITMPTSRVSAWVIPTNEELMLARHAQDLLASGGAA